MSYRLVVYVLCSLPLLSLLVFTFFLETGNRKSTLKQKDAAEYEQYLYQTHDRANNRLLNLPPRQIPAIISDPNDYSPKYSSLLDILTTWNPDNADPPPSFQETIPHFNYSDTYERSVAELYRDREIPFKLYNIPDLALVSRRWSNIYLMEQMKNVEPHVEKSVSNHFMFWNVASKRRNKGFKTPTDIVDMTFSEWLSYALKADEKEVQDNKALHYYFMAASSPGRYSNFVGRDLPFFSTNRNNFFITNVYANKGIQCRFGMRGIISEAHYDQGRNMVAMIKGAKRYILTPPASCTQLGIITDKRHPSFRHSQIDWSDPKQSKAADFGSVNAIDTIVREGEMLYIPSYWFHYIVSLSYSAQCNSRSGEPPNKEGFDDIDQCMGGMLLKLRAKKEKKKDAT